MADQNASSEGRQISIRIDESHMNTTYANTIRTSTTADEVVLDFGLNLPMQNPQNPQQAMMVFNVSSRVVMNWTGVKRLANSLQGAVKAFEDANGEIRLERGGNR